MKKNIIYFQDGRVEEIISYDINVVKDPITTSFRTKTDSYIYIGELVGGVGSGMFEKGTQARFFRWDDEEDMFVADSSIRYISLEN